MKEPKVFRREVLIMETDLVIGLEQIKERINKLPNLDLVTIEEKSPKSETQKRLYVVTVSRPLEWFPDTIRYRNYIQKT
jgi:replication initiation and membrane attachment protein DnaB